MWSFNDFLALFAIMFWLVIPLFWIPVHFATGFFRKLGLLTYIMPVFTWLPLAYLVYHNREFVLGFKIEMPSTLTYAGATAFLLGTLLHIWTARLLTFRGIIGMPEVSLHTQGKLVTSGPFSVVRHPTYLAHTLMFFGVFFMTGVVTVGAVALIDYAVVNLFVIPLEERELLRRFSDGYREYMKEVPRFFPRMVPK